MDAQQHAAETMHIILWVDSPSGVWAAQSTSDNNELKERAACHIRLLHIVKQNPAYLSHQTLEEPASLKDRSSRFPSIVSVVVEPQQAKGADVKDGAKGAHYEPASTTFVFKHDSNKPYHMGCMSNSATKHQAIAIHHVICLDRSIWPTSAWSFHQTTCTACLSWAVLYQLECSLSNSGTLTCRLPEAWRSISWVSSQTRDPSCPCKPPARSAVQPYQLCKTEQTLIAIGCSVHGKHVIIEQIAQLEDDSVCHLKF